MIRLMYGCLSYFYPELPGCATNFSKLLHFIMNQQKEIQTPAEKKQRNTSVQGKDYTTFSTKKILQEAKTLLAVENNELKKADKLFKTLKLALDNRIQQEHQASKTKYIEEGGKEDGFIFKTTAYDSFHQDYESFQKRKTKYFEDAKKNKENNLKAKRTIIEQIRQILAETNQKNMLLKVKSLQVAWKKIGAVPQIEADNLYKTYDALMSRFYDTKRIEYDLLTLDREKNLEKKLKLCKQAEDLLALQNIKEATRHLRKLYDKFRSVGPIPSQQREQVWQRFKKTADKLYDRKREISDAFKTSLNDNMKLKQALCMRVEAYIDFTSENPREWQDTTKELLQIQREWERVGKIPKEVTKDINKQFWTNFKRFFENKNRFFETLEAERAKNLELKEALITKAENLKDSEDWKNTAQALKKLQEEWKHLGAVPEGKRTATYARFKAACDIFFTRKREDQASMEQTYKNNLTKKLEICQHINILAKENPTDIQALQTLKDAYFKTGFVPKSEIKNIINKYSEALDTFFDATHMKQQQKEKARLDAQIELYRKVPNAINHLSRKQHSIRKKVSTLENDISLWKNNLHFFSNSKTAAKLVEDFQHKIHEAQQELSRLKKQIKIIENT